MGKKCVLTGPPCLIRKREGQREKKTEKRQREKESKRWRELVK